MTNPTPNSSTPNETETAKERDLYRSRWLACVTPEEAQRLYNEALETAAEVVLTHYYNGRHHVAERIRALKSSTNLSTPPERTPTQMISSIVSPAPIVKSNPIPRCVILESPYAASTSDETAANVAYARACVRDSLMRREAPMASHLLYAQDGILDDKSLFERALGIAAGLAWGHAASFTAVYIDRGISPGMTQGIERAMKEGRAIQYRRLTQTQGTATDFLYIDVVKGTILLDPGMTQGVGLAPGHSWPWIVGLDGL